MSKNSNNVHFSGERFICNTYVIIIIPRFARADNDKIQAANEEIVKWGFWRKLPLLPLLWHANTVDEN